MKERNNSELYNKGYNELQNLWENIKQFKQLCIYSAGNRAKELIQMQKIGFLELQKKSCFWVTGMHGNRESVDNPEYIDDIPVYVLNEHRKVIDRLGLIPEQTAVLVVAMEHYHQEISESLMQTPFKNIFYLTDIMERILIADCMEHYYQKLNMDFQMTEMCDKDRNDFVNKSEKTSAMTYMVQCAQDVKLTETRKEREWITPLQAGAALTDVRVANVTDADGDNISEKNPYYNEMTGLYWLWKNTNLDYSGICHYRRQFESDVVWKYLWEDKADVILPTPALVYPDLAGYYLNWGEKAYYEMMLQVVKEKYFEYYETALWCAKHPIFYPNNIFIAKREILEDYCKFAFSVIDEVEERMKTYEGAKQKRCWLSEHVTTIYFMKHYKDYRVVFSNLKRYW